MEGVLMEQIITSNETNNNINDGSVANDTALSPAARKTMVKFAQQILRGREATTSSKLPDEYYDFITKTLERAESESKTEQK